VNSKLLSERTQLHCVNVFKFAVMKTWNTCVEGPEEDGTDDGTSAMGYKSSKCHPAI
jgi:hypothetical protein